MYTYRYVFMYTYKQIYIYIHIFIYTWWAKVTYKRGCKHTAPLQYTATRCRIVAMGEGNIQACLQLESLDRITAIRELLSAQIINGNITALAQNAVLRYVGLFHTCLFMLIGLFWIRVNEKRRVSRSRVKYASTEASHLSCIMRCSCGVCRLLLYVSFRLRQRTHHKQICVNGHITALEQDAVLRYVRYVYTSLFVWTGFFWCRVSGKRRVNWSLLIFCKEVYCEMCVNEKHDSSLATRGA